jgi:hypothetical protein
MHPASIGLGGTREGFVLFDFPTMITCGALVGNYEFPRLASTLTERYCQYKIDRAAQNQECINEGECTEGLLRPTGFASPLDMLRWQGF